LLHKRSITAANRERRYHVQLQAPSCVQMLSMVHHVLAGALMARDASGSKAAAHRLLQ
jgi:hypothetical protein